MPMPAPATFRTIFHERRPPTRSTVAAPKATWVNAIARLSTRKDAATTPRSLGARLSSEARLLEIEVPLNAAHHFWADLARVAQGQDGFPFGSEQFAPPVAPVPGALRILLGRAAGLEA